MTNTPMHRTTLRASAARIPNILLCAAGVLSALACAPGTASASDAAAFTLVDAETQLLDVMRIDADSAWVTAAGPDSGLYALDLNAGTLADIDLGLPFGAPGRMISAMDNALSLNLPIICDWNSEVDVDCCNGYVGRYDAGSTTLTPLYLGNDIPIVGDPFGIAWSPGGAWPGGIFASDFQGASTEPPFLYHINTSGSASVFYTDGALFGTSDELNDITFAPMPEFGSDLFVAVDSGSDPQNDGIWTFNSAGVPTQFVQIPAACAICFAYSCDEPTLFALSYTGQLYAVTPAGDATLVLENLPLGSGNGLGGIEQLNDSQLIAAFGSRVHVIRMCGADYDGNCMVDVNDLLLLLAHWSTVDDPDHVDLTGDGAVDVDDLLQLLAAWGPCD